MACADRPRCSIRSGILMVFAMPSRCRCISWGSDGFVTGFGDRAGTVPRYSNVSRQPEIATSAHSIHVCLDDLLVTSFAPCTFNFVLISAIPSYAIYESNCNYVYMQMEYDYKSSKNAELRTAENLSFPPAGNPSGNSSSHLHIPIPPN